MATRRYKVSQGENEYQVVEEVGAAADSDTVELTVDLGVSPAPTKRDVLEALELLKQHIDRNIWPPA